MIFNKKRPFGAKRKISWLGPDLLAFCFITHKWEEYIGRRFECQGTIKMQQNKPFSGLIITFLKNL
jgi:hypothetical protein